MSGHSNIELRKQKVVNRLSKAYLKAYDREYLHKLVPTAFEEQREQLIDTVHATKSKKLKRKLRIRASIVFLSFVYMVITIYLKLNGVSLKYGLGLMTLASVYYIIDFTKFYYRAQRNIPTYFNT